MATAWEPQPEPVGSRRDEHAARAIALFRSLQHACYDERRGLYRQHRHWRRCETLWPSANAWAATCALAGLNEALGEEMRRALDRLIAAQPTAALRYAARRDRGPGNTEALELGSVVHRTFVTPVARRLWRIGTPYFDDNVWVALALLHQHRLTGARDCLQLAERVFSFVRTGWVASGWSHPGGIRWADAKWSRGRHTCSSAPAAEVAAELFLLTGNADYLDWAMRTYAWVWQTLRLESGLFADLITPEGHVDATIWSYNQGTMIGAGALLHEATGDAGYLAEAGEVAEASLGRFGRPAALAAQPPEFAAIYLRNLLYLGGRAPNEAYATLARDYAELLWRNWRDPLTGMISFRSATTVNTTAPLVAVEALLAGSAPHP